MAILVDKNLIHLKNVLGAVSTNVGSRFFVKLLNIIFSHG